MDSDNYIIELQEITYTLPSGRIIFDSLNFQLTHGETAIITGSVGKGKTSLIELLIGLKRAQSGNILLFGKKFSPKKEADKKSIRRKVGGVGGIFRPISYQTVMENMQYPQLFRKTRIGDPRKIIMDNLSNYSLLNKKNELVAELSRGEKMLLMLARATVANQPLLLIDEPLAGLDMETSIFIAKMLNKLSIAGHSQIILTSGQTDLNISNATHYTLLNGQLI
ncbi:MAG: ATP-binding cassette domain-containing protein [Candidatus Zixiibacteriota bacterium]